MYRPNRAIGKLSGVKASSITKRLRVRRLAIRRVDRGLLLTVPSSRRAGQTTVQLSKADTGNHPVLSKFCLNDSATNRAPRSSAQRLEKSGSPSLRTITSQPAPALESLRSSHDCTRSPWRRRQTSSPGCRWRGMIAVDPTGRPVTGPATPRVTMRAVPSLPKLVVLGATSG
jgi:hypothetical protein